MQFRCGLCGFETDDSTEFDEHLKRHTDDLYDNVVRRLVDETPERYRRWHVDRNEAKEA